MYLRLFDRRAKLINKLKNELIPVSATVYKITEIIRIEKRSYPVYVKGNKFTILKDRDSCRLIKYKQHNMPLYTDDIDDIRRFMLDELDSEIENIPINKCLFYRVQEFRGQFYIYSYNGVEVVSSELDGIVDYIINR